MTIGRNLSSRGLPADRRLTALVESGVDVRLAVQEIAERIAAVPSHRPEAAPLDGSTSALLAAWADRHQTLAAHADLLTERQLPGSLFSEAQSYLMGRGRLLSERLREGRSVVVRRALVAQEIFVLADGTLHVTNDSTTHPWGEGLPDVAWLALDLEVIGAPELGTELLRDYRESASDLAPASLTNHYLAYAALSRAAEECLNAHRAGAGRAPLADAFLRSGALHSEKATVRLALGTGTSDGDWAHLDFARTRRDLAAMAMSQSRRGHAVSRIYGPTLDALTYGELLHRAEQLLQRGESVVIDGTWSDEAWAEEAHRLARRAGAMWGSTSPSRPEPTTERASLAR